MDVNESKLAVHKRILADWVEGERYEYEDDSILTFIENVKAMECDLSEVTGSVELSKQAISEFVEKALKAKTALTDDNCFAVKKCSILLRWHEPEHCNCEKTKCSDCVLALLEKLGMNSYFM